MTTRRSFLKRLAITAAGFAVGANLLTEKCTAASPVLGDGIHPDWLNAPYLQDFIFFTDPAFVGYKFAFDHSALRFEIVDGKWQELRTAKR